MFSLATIQCMNAQAAQRKLRRKKGTQKPQTQKAKKTVNPKPYTQSEMVELYNCNPVTEQKCPKGYRFLTVAEVRYLNSSPGPVREDKTRSDVLFTCAGLGGVYHEVRNRMFPHRPLNIDKSPNIKTAYFTKKPFGWFLAPEDFDKMTARGHNPYLLSNGDVGARDGWRLLDYVEVERLADQGLVAPVWQYVHNRWAYFEVERNDTVRAHVNDRALAGHVAPKEPVRLEPPSAFCYGADNTSPQVIGNGIIGVDMADAASKTATQILNSPEYQMAALRDEVEHLTGRIVRLEHEKRQLHKDLNEARDVARDRHIKLVQSQQEHAATARVKDDFAKNLLKVDAENTELRKELEKARRLVAGHRRSLLAVRDVCRKMDAVAGKFIDNALAGSDAAFNSASPIDGASAETPK